MGLILKIEKFDGRQYKGMDPVLQYKVMLLASSNNRASATKRE